MAPTKETKQKPVDSDESEEEEEEEEKVVHYEVDVNKLTPLSPEVISKQVRAEAMRIYAFTY